MNTFDLTGRGKSWRPNVFGNALIKNGIGHYVQCVRLKQFIPVTNAARGFAFVVLFRVILVILFFIISFRVLITKSNNSPSPANYVELSHRWFFIDTN